MQVIFTPVFGMAVCIKVIQIWRVWHDSYQMLLWVQDLTRLNAYSGAFNKWHDRAKKYDKCVIPAVLDVFLYSWHLAHLSRSSQSPAYIKFIDKQKAVAGLSCAHKLAWVQDLALSSIVTFTHDGFKWRLSKPVTKKEPVSPEIIKGLISPYILLKGNNPWNLMNSRTVTMCVIAYICWFPLILRICQYKIKILNFHRIWSPYLHTFEQNWHLQRRAKCCHQ